MKTTSARGELLRTGAGLALVGALALSACAPEDGPANFEDSEPASADETVEETEEGTETEAETDTATETDAEDEQGSAADEQDGAAQDDQDESAQEDAEEDADSSAAEGSSVIDPEDAVETVTYPILDEDLDGEMTVGFHHLRVEGQTMELLLTYTPEFDNHGTFDLWRLHNSNHSLVQPALYDRENLKRYNILRSGGGYDHNHWATDQASVDLASGQTQAYWANFAVPEDDIAAISIGMPAGPEFKDVEIDWGEGEPADQDTEVEDFEADEDADTAEESDEEDGE